MKQIIKIPNISEITTGQSERNNIVSTSLAEFSNSGTELTLGSVCAVMLECSIRNPNGGVNAVAGTEAVLYEEDDNGNRIQIGLFTLEKPTRKNAHIINLTAYDRVSWLDKDLTAWLNALEGWPYTLGTFARMVCEQCGLTLKSTTFPNSDYMVPVFVADGITGRKLMEWIGEIAARFVRATPDGEIELAWYAENPNNITPSGEHYFYGGGLSYEDYQVAAIENVQIRLTGDDIGVAYPGTDGEANTYTITGNYLLTATDPAQLEPVARVVYEQIKDVRYTPCTVKLPANNNFHAGDIVTITDANGFSFSTYVMEKSRKGQRDTLKSTGSIRRSSPTAMHEESFRAYNAKLLEIRKDIEGLNVKATNIQTTVEENQKSVIAQIAEIDIRADGIQSSVTEELNSVRSEMTAIIQTSSEIAAKVEKYDTDGVTKLMSKGVTVDERGLTISEDGKPTSSTLDHDGLEVYRTSDGEVILEAKDSGVNALNVTVRRYLTVGKYSRIEDYSDGSDTRRTGIFWIGGDT